MVGICNISLNQLQSLEAKELLPDIIQVEIYPYHANKEVIDFAHSRSIIVEARSPFAHGDAMEEWLNEPILKRIAEEHKATIPQVILRWITQQEVIALPRTSSVLHLKENVDSLGLSLSNEEMLEIDSLNRNKSYGFISIKQ